MAKQKEIKPRVSIKREVPKLPGYIMCVVWLIFTILLIGWVILASFSTSREILSGELFKFASGFHFENYTNAWKSQKISVFFVNSLIYTAISCTMIILVAAPAAYALSRFKFRGNMILQNLFATALGIPVIMIVMPLFSIITSLKLTNTRGLIMFLYIAMNVPFSIFFLLAFFSNLSYTFEEAAAIDGCSPIRTFFSVVLPIMKPTYISVGILETMWIWNDFLLPYLTLDIKKYKTISIVIQYMKGSYGRVDMGAIMAALIMAVIPVVIFYLSCQKHIIKGVAAGAVKG